LLQVQVKDNSKSIHGDHGNPTEVTVDVVLAWGSAEWQLGNTTKGNNPQAGEVIINQ